MNWKCLIFTLYDYNKVLFIKYTELLFDNLNNQCNK